VTVRAVIFDWDGTLADSHRSLYAANAAVMRAFGLPFTDELYRRHYSPDWRLMYRRLGITDDRVDEANRIWQDAFHGGAPTSLLPGVLEAVERLEVAGVLTGLVTSGGHGIVEPQIRRLGLDRWIAVRVFGDDLAEQKPHPAPLRKALAGLGVAAASFGDVAYLGDAPEDMQMAVAAGVHAIGVVSVFSNPELLRAAGAEEVVESVADWVAAQTWLPAGAVPRAS
jgi:HAD superfamily hydrolase (TIGR01549 family)